MHAPRKADLLTRLISLEKDQVKRSGRIKEAMEFVAAHRPVLAARTASNQLAFDYRSMVELYSYVVSSVDTSQSKAFSDYIHKQYVSELAADIAFTFDVATSILPIGQVEPARLELRGLLDRRGDALSPAIRATALKIVLFANQHSDVGRLRSEYFPATVGTTLRAD